MYTNSPYSNNDFNTVPVYSINEQITNEHDLVPVYTSTYSNNSQLYSNNYDNYTYQNNSDCNIQLLPTNSNVVQTHIQPENNTEVETPKNNGSLYIIGFTCVVVFILGLIAINYGKITPFLNNTKH